MTPDRRSRVLRTALQAAVPAALLLVGNVLNVLPSVLSGSGLVIATAVLTVITSALQNMLDARNEAPAEG